MEMVCCQSEPSLHSSPPSLVSSWDIVPWLAVPSLSLHMWRWKGVGREGVCVNISCAGLSRARNGPKRFPMAELGRAGHGFVIGCFQSCTLILRCRCTM